MCVCVCVLCLSREEEESLCADKLPMEYSESTVAPEASHGPRGRDSGRERGRVEKQCDGGWREGASGERGLHRLSELIKEPRVCCVCTVPCPEGGWGYSG